MEISLSGNYPNHSNINSPLPVNPLPTTSTRAAEIHHLSSTVCQHTPVPLFLHPQFLLFCKIQLTSPAHNLVIPLPIVSTVQFRRNKIEQSWLPWGIQPGLQRWELDIITTTLPFTVMCRTPDLIFSYSSPYKRHFPPPHHAPTFSRIYPPGGPGRLVLKIVRQSPRHHHTPSNNSSNTSHKIRRSVSASPPFIPRNLVFNFCLSCLLLVFNKMFPW